ncbi:hypothetical protein HN51_056095 [Arachis hypogaea]|uniref:Alpha-methyl-mannoside-specific lectin n=1 Tax=Arachis hypogaea TaxID=3818 RepID=A0A444XTG3_ARAHY|nr:mannose/glucose-specific lectin [Arachis ipaensis]XP_025679512.1 mannose/glucose-specific lectin-like [Arachis hypogaea]QHN78893.1 Alpha-methyl-mannoside-specific lectin [Arachis hypogaea]RYQ92756.1 hypothetical protein Ahy_B09g098980 [Arachis hypogaea]
MAVSNSNLAIITITILLMLLNRACSLNSLGFSFDNYFHQEERNLILQGDAKISQTNTLQLTSTPNKVVGRVLHSFQLQLWDKSTNKLASFDSQFSFVLTSPVRGPADGIAFFITSPNSTIPQNSGGGYLGLFNSKTALSNTSSNQVVAVEFDTYINPTYDPNYNHIGIDINSIKSSKLVRWDRRENETLDVLVSYHAETQTLEVKANYPDGQSYEVSHEIDLRTVLPEWVRVGFSASSGNQYQSHSVLSWSFYSGLYYIGHKNEYLASDI